MTTGKPAVLPPTEATAADFGPALVAARRAAGLLQKQLAPLVNQSPRTLMRWERGQAMPRVDSRDAIVGWLRSRPGAEADRALEALGVRFVRMTAAPLPGAPLSPEAARGAKLAIEQALYKAAEANDVTARVARKIAVAVLAAAEGASITAGAARALLDVV
jgi:transcriptional regulator with XRE-family HTH domain